MRGGDLVFARSPSLASRFIRLLDGGNFSHVAVAVDPENIVEATASGVVKRPLSEWPDDVQRVVYAPIMDEEDRQDVIRQANRIAADGWSYNWPTFIGMGLYWLTGGRLAVSAGAKAAICSALAADALHAGGEYFEVHPLFMTPKMLQRHFGL